ncbi:CopD family protein [Kineococcus sp. GCM10028916]|uniref:CopD family protein n=1 Tax=Kineococcus sp. GCM10028916 TaxID=3273394 RepID=UPI0036394231
MTSDTNSVSIHHVPTPDPTPDPVTTSLPALDDEVRPAFDSSDETTTPYPASTEAVGPSRARLIATVVLIALLVLGLLLWWGHHDADSVWLPVARLGARIGAVVAVGLFLVLWLLPQEDREVLGPRGPQVVMRWATCATIVWSLSATAELLLRYQDAVKAPIWRDVTGAGTFLLGSGEGALHTAHVVLTLLLLVLALRTPDTRGVSRFLAMAVVAIGTLPFILVYPQKGHLLPPSAALGDAAHVLGALLWTGGLIGLVVVLVLVDRAGTLPPSTTDGNVGGWGPCEQRRLDSLTRAVDAYSLLALVAALVVTLSGVLMAWATIGSWWPLRPPGQGVPETYLGLVVAKVVGTLVLLAAGYRHRTRTMPRLRRNERKAFMRLAVGEVGLMVAVMSLGVLLSFAH